ncbi:hypothetical protein LCGC14_1645010 [marine sediment metagenome]|uniref:Uncharacterized protein n=1 Tax=marine sediment metagenome TaxID=412755 RepID=A0A0F9HYH4_9ZZZZ
MSKGSKRRPCLVPRWRVDLNWSLLRGEVTIEEYDKIVKEHENENSRTD